MKINKIFKGAAFSELWKRENKRLAYKWNVLKFEREEIDLPDFERSKEEILEKVKTANELQKLWYAWQRYFKIFISYSVLLFMVNIRES